MELVNPKPAEWRQRFGTHHAALRAAWPTAQIEHIGSTAIGGILTKDVVDLLVGVRTDEIPLATRSFCSAGYVQEGERNGHVWLCWPDPNCRDTVVHVVEYGGQSWVERQIFRDHLQQHPEIAQAYERLKLSLARSTADWGEYTQGKADFVQQVLKHGLASPFIPGAG